MEGSVLVVDEADKAPTHVTCILKTLVESGEMILSDGRRIVPASSPRCTVRVTSCHVTWWSRFDGVNIAVRIVCSLISLLLIVTSFRPISDRIIRAHPDFRMIVLANRPGFPFLGNDFFGALVRIRSQANQWQPFSFIIHCRLYCVCLRINDSLFLLSFIVDCIVSAYTDVFGVLMCGCLFRGFFLIILFSYFLLKWRHDLRIHFQSFF